jgi:glutamine synthetase
MTMAAIDGIENKIDPGDPMDKNIYHLTPRNTKKSARPRLAGRGAGRLEEDHDFLLKGDVFTADVIHYWIKYKRRTKWMRSARGRIRMSFACILIFESHKFVDSKELLG